MIFKGKELLGGSITHPYSGVICWYISEAVNFASEGSIPSAGALFRKVFNESD